MLWIIEITLGLFLKKWSESFCWSSVRKKKSLHIQNAWCWEGRDSCVKEPTAAPGAFFCVSPQLHQPAHSSSASRRQALMSFSFSVCFYTCCRESWLNCNIVRISGRDWWLKILPWRSRRGAEFANNINPPTLIIRDKSSIWWWWLRKTNPYLKGQKLQSCVACTLTQGYPSFLCWRLELHLSARIDLAAVMSRLSAQTCSQTPVVPPFSDGAWRERHRQRLQEALLMENIVSYCYCHMSLLIMCTRLNTGQADRWNNWGIIKPKKSPQL